MSVIHEMVADVSVIPVADTALMTGVDASVVNVKFAEVVLPVAVADIAAY